MNIFNQHLGLYTDFYELTMAQGYFLDGRKDVTAGFDYFCRTNPFQGGYILFAGLQDLLDILQSLKFEDEDCAYLKQVGFKDEFLRYLKKFRFRGNIFSVCEGEVVFPLEPVLRVEGNIIETQIIESMVLNILNFESLIATKASRVRRSAGDSLITDFGLRRAQGFGGVHASRACIIGGFNSTSNVLSAFTFGLKPVGTQAHSWIQSFPDELTAFRHFVKYYPDRCILLVDTYNTLKSGVPNAITVAKELERQGKKLFGIRLDSGDLAYLSKQARKMLDQEGLGDVIIIASNQLDEYVIRSLRDQGAGIDAYGVGTRVITGQPDAALDGVYKMSMIDGKPKLKLSENKEKMTLPGVKKIIRVVNENKEFYADAIVLTQEETVDMIYHPLDRERNVRTANLPTEEIQSAVMEDGKLKQKKMPVEQIAAFAQQRLGLLPDEHKRFENPHIYKVGVSQKVLDLQGRLATEARAKNVKKS